MHCARNLTLLVCSILAALALSFAIPVSVANAQLTPSVSEVDLGTELEPFLDKAKEKGLGVIIITPLEPEEEAKAPATSWQEDGLRLRQELGRIIAGTPKLYERAKEAIIKSSPDGTMWWLVYAFGIGFIGICLMTGTFFVFAKANRHVLQTMIVENPKNRAEKIGYLMLRAGVLLANNVFGFCVAIVVAIILDYEHEPSRATILIILVAWAFYWVFRAVILFNIIAHDLPKHRLINLDDDNAKMVQFDWRNSMVAVIIAFSVTAWFEALEIHRDAYKLMLLASMTLAVLTFGYLTFKHRKPFSGVLLGAGEPAMKPLWRRVFADYWHMIALGYLAAAWAISVYRNVLDLPSATLVVAAPIVAFLAGVGIYGITLFLIDKAYQARQRRFDVKVALAREKEKVRRELEQVAIEAALRDAPEDDEELIINKVMAEKKMEEMPAFRPVFKPLLEQAAGILITIVAVGFVLGTWDVNIGEQGNPITAFIDTLMIGFVGWFLYRAVAAYIDDQIAEEGDDVPDGAPDGEMGGQGASRLTTLLPLIRNVMIAGIIVLTAMVILSNMGVDIAPLFAGAGVIGLAIGFGAQTLIRDIFSGGFFLFDDAFRRGEYIELDGIVGTVEKISLRSFQLRHHNGPLHTVPFGEIKQLTNFSRDWVMMKLPLRLTYDTDIERVRKLVKKLGQRLLEHPDVGHLFLQPLKSQGVYKMEDSAMIVRVKFMTKPGDQFVTRKVVYQHIRELFEQEGIKFAHKEVTVRLADEPQRPLTPKEEKAVAAAARASVDADMDDLESVASDDGP